MRRSIFIFFILGILLSCGTSNVFDVNAELQELVNVGYSVDELALRTNYSVADLVDAYHQNSDVLDDTLKNAIIHDLLEKNTDGKIIPIEKTNLSAYDAIWQVYTKAQNLARASMYTGIGVTKVANALMQRKTLTGEDSLRALIGYVNAEYGIEEMPQSIDKYFTKMSAIKDVVVPVTFVRNYPDEVRAKIEYYIWQNEQFELKANENLKKTIESRVDSHVKNAINDFVDDDLNSLVNTGKNIFKDSLETAQFYKEKLNARLNLENLDKSIQDEVITYCISVNCSRAILIGEVLNYQDFSNGMNATTKKRIADYVTNLEDITLVMQKKKKNLGVDAAIFAVSIPVMCYTGGVVNPASSMTSMQAVKIFVLETLEYTGLDQFFKDLFGYKESEQVEENLTKTIETRLNKQMNEHLSKTLNSKKGYFEGLNKNTTDYYNEVRKRFNVK